jgi:hypothetical protein
MKAPLLTRSLVPVGDYGLGSYLETAAQIGEREKSNTLWVLSRMLGAKAFFGLAANEYAQFGLHGKSFARLRDYRTKKQTTRLVGRLNPFPARWAVDDKLTFQRICLEAGLPVPPILAVLSQEAAGTEGFPSYPNLDAALESLHDAEDLKLFVKPRNDTRGNGVRFLRLRRGEMFDIEDRPIDRARLDAELSSEVTRDDYLIQEFIRPHPLVAALGSGKALGTLRVLSLSQGQTTRLLYALLRIPCGSNSHDNFSSGSSGNLIANVDLESGELGAAYGRRDRRFSRLLERFESNPDTGKRIAGQKIPDWATIRGFVERAARSFELLPLLAWDIAVSDKGNVIIEANSNPDIIGAQVCSGRGARSFLGDV